MSRYELNPIFDFAAQGQQFENKGRYDKAVHWYQRALACLPNHFGNQIPIRQPNGSGLDPAQFTQAHASRIYSAMGRCLVSLDRRLDAQLALGAACLLNPADRRSERRLHDLKTNRNTRDHVSNYVNDKMTSTADLGEMDLSAYLTLIMVTHCTKNLQRFKALLPPSCKLVTATYGSLTTIFGDPVLRCPKILCYDSNPDETDCDVRYSRSLEQFSRQHGFELNAYPGVGLFNILNRVIPEVATPYVLFVEHDWLFKGDPIQLGGIVDMMERNRHINSIRLNKRDNWINGMDFIMTVEPSEDRHALLRTSTYSNNPCVIRTEMLRDVWLPACTKALQRIASDLGGSPFGVEEVLFRRLVEDIRQLGFDTAHQQWGTYIYGGIGDPQRLIHLGE